MSQVMSKIKQYRSKYHSKHKSGESTSNYQAQSWTVGDSCPSRSKCITNESVTGTFTLLMPMLFILTILMGSISLNHTNVSAAGGSMTVTISDTTVDLNVSPSTNGTFAKSDASVIGVSTTNATGYTLSLTAQAGSNPTSLINGTDNTKMFPSIQSAITEDQFKALDGGTAYNNMWGYLPSKYCANGLNTNCSANTSFLPSPTTSGDILDITSTANIAVNEYEITIGARVDTTASLGTYSNTFVLYATANAVPYTIIYYDNLVDNMPTDSSGETTGSTVTISNNTPTRTGYTFLGWCKTIPATSNGVDSCSTTPITPGGTLDIDQEGTNNFTLYAMWSKNKSIDDLTYMQDFNTLSSTDKTSVINLMQEGKGYYLMDNRDREVYMIAKLKDGRVWMLDNLRLGDNSAMSLNSGNTNSNGNWTLPAGITSGFDSYTAAQINVTYKHSVATSYGQGSGKVGVYYNYCAASAGTICVSSDAQNTDYDVCPAGWRMPFGGLNGEYAALSNQYSTMQAADTDSTQYNFSTPLSGLFHHDKQMYLDVEGYFWSSTYYYADNNGMYTLNVGPSNIEPTAYSYRIVGRSVRCLLK